MGARADSSGSQHTFQRRPVAVDLFAGAGGLSLGFEQAGFDILAAVEYDPIAAAVHKFNFPRTEIVCADAATVLAEDVRAAARKGWAAHHGETDWDGTIDAVIGGPPCQGFSLIGKRAFDDPRNQLVNQFVRLVQTLHPRYFVMENVPGMTSVCASEKKSARKLLELIVEQLKENGYGVLEPQILNAYDYGVPQDRQRLILIGYRHDETAPVYPEKETRGRTRQARTKKLVPEEKRPELCPTVWEAIGDLPNLDRIEELRASDVYELDEGELKAIEETASPYARRLRELDRDPTNFAWPRSWRKEFLTSSLRTVHDEGVVARFEKTDPGHSEPVSRLFRLHADGACSTLRAGTHYERGSFNAPRPIHPKHARVISVREAARLHSFPDWFRFNWTKWHGFREIGNSLPPLVGRAVGAVIGDALGNNAKKPRKRLPLGDTALLYMDNSAAIAHFDADASRAPRHAQRWRKRRPKARKPTSAVDGAKRRRTTSPKTSAAARGEGRAEPKRPARFA